MSGTHEGKPTLRYIQDMMTGEYTFRENGAQRAQRRAARKGLTVGAPVRAVVMTKTRPGPQRPLTPLERVDRLARYMLQRALATHVRQGVGWRPSARQRRRLDKKERAGALRAYVVGKMEEAAYAANNPRGYALAMTDTRGPAASAVIVDEPPRIEVPGLTETIVSIDPARDAADASGFVVGVPVKANSEYRVQGGFRVVDRRGEHR